MKTTLFILTIVGLIIHYLLKKGKIKINKETIGLKSSKIESAVYVIEPYMYLRGSMEQEFSMLMNRYRETTNSGHLICDRRTVEIALERAENFYDTERKDFNSHQGIGDANIQLFTFGADSTTELLGYGYNSAEGFFKSLKNSEKHNKSLLNPEMDWFGLGVCKNKLGRNIWCLILGNESNIKN